MSAGDRLLKLLSGDPGDPLPLHLGDPTAEVEAARRAAGLGIRTGRGQLLFAGEDRHEFLHRMLTASIRPGGPGSGVRTLMLDGKGHVIADLDLLEDAAGLLGVTGRSAARDVAAGLSRYVLRARVTMEPLEGLRSLALVGPDAGSHLIAAGASLPDGVPGSTRAEVAGSPVRVVRTPTLPAGFELLVDIGDAREVAGALLQDGVVPLGGGVLEALRIEAGVPAHDAEITGDEFPQEARLDTWVDFEKGCYLGQETVARIHYRGKVNRLLCGFQLDGEAAAGASLAYEDRQVGTLTSVARSTTGPGLVALGYLRRELAEPDTVVVADGGVCARVVPTPMS